MILALFDQPKVINGDLYMAYLIRAKISQRLVEASTKMHKN